MMDMKGVLLQWFTISFDKKTSGGAIRNEIMSNKKLEEESSKPIVTKAKKRTLIFHRQYWGC